MKEKCVLSIFLDSTNKPFYTASDVISGYVRAVVFSKIQVTDLDLVLQCEERASVPINKRDLKSSYAKKVRGLHEKVRHYLTVQHPLHTEEGEEPLLLEKGEYTYPFTFHLSDDINSFPPHAPIRKSQGIYAGVWWSMEAKVHRPKMTQSAYKTSVDIPIQPLPAISGLHEKMENERTIVGGFAVVQDKPNFVELLKGQRATANIFEAQLSYPVTGIPQKPHKSQFGLVLRCDRLTIQISSIEATILQKCKAKARQLDFTYVKEFPMGLAKMSHSLASDSIDVSNLVEQFMLSEILVVPFTSKLVTVTYELRLKIAFVPLMSNTNSKPRTLIIETPVVLQSPVVNWAKDQFTKMKPVPKPTFRDSFSDPGVGFLGSLPSGSGPKSVGDTTAVTEATGTGTSSSYLSYEVQRPGQVISNVMQWFGKSNRNL